MAEDEQPREEFSPNYEGDTPKTPEEEAKQEDDELLNSIEADDGKECLRQFYEKHKSRAIPRETWQLLKNYKDEIREPILETMDWMDHQQKDESLQLLRAIDTMKALEKKWGHQERPVTRRKPKKRERTVTRYHQLSKEAQKPAKGQIASPG